MSYSVVLERGLHGDCLPHSPQLLGTGERVQATHDEYYVLRIEGVTLTPMQARFTIVENALMVQYRGETVVVFEYGSTSREVPQATAELLEALNAGRISLGAVAGMKLQATKGDAIRLSAIIDDVDPNTGVVPDGGTTDDETPLLQGMVDEVELQDAEVMIYRDNLPVGSVAAVDGSWSYQEEELSDGTYSYHVNLNDADHRVLASSTTYTITIDDCDNGFLPAFFIIGGVAGGAVALAGTGGGGGEEDEDRGRPPSGSDGSIVLPEDGWHAFAGGDFGYRDSDGDPLKAVRIESLPQAGLLEAGGSAATVGQVIAAADLGTLVFRPGADEYGSDYASFAFRVQESGGAWAAAANTLSIEVSAVADIVDDSLVTDEDTAVTTNLLTNDTFEAVPEITGVSQGGHGTVSIVDGALGTITYTPEANWYGTDTFTYTVTSAGTTETASVRIAVNPVDDGPLSVSAIATYAVKSDYGVGNQPLTLAVDDMDGDGSDDIMVVNYNNGFSSISLLFNDGEGDYTDQGSNTTYEVWSLDPYNIGYGYQDSSRWVTTADVDLDGDADLIFTKEYWGSVVGVALNSGTGSFSGTSGDILIGSEYSSFWVPYVVATGDLNGDGYPDLVSGNAYPFSGSTHLTVRLSNGAPFSSSSQRNYSVDSTGLEPYDILIEDLDLDGDLDLLVGIEEMNGGTIETANSKLLIYRNNGDGTFANAETFITGSYDSAYTLLDVDGVNGVDLIIPDAAEDRISVRLNDGTGTFGSPVYYDTGDYPTDITVGDYDGDGIDDLAFSMYRSNGVGVMLGRSDGTFEAYREVVAAVGPWDIGSADVDGDGKDDLIFSNTSSDTVSVVTRVISPFFPEQQARAVSPDMVVHEPDGDPAWIGATLRVQVRANAEAADRLELPSINPGGEGIWLAADGNRLMAGEVHVGTADAASASGGDAWTFTFNANITNDLVQEVARSVAFVHTGEVPGTAIRTVRFTFSQTDGSTASKELPVEVVPVGDAPSGGAISVTIDEDSFYSFAAHLDEFENVFSDIDGNSLVGIMVTSLPLNGQIRVDGEVITQSDIDAYGGVDITFASIDYEFVYLPSSNVNGTDAFSFRVRDDGGQANGGVDLDQTTRTFTINVTPVSDTPESADATITLQEDGSYTFSTADFAFTDVDGDTLRAVRIDSLPLKGVLQLAGSAVTPSQLILAADLGQLTYAPAADQSGTAYTTFRFSVQDSTEAFDAVYNTITINVTAVDGYGLPGTSSSESLGYSLSGAGDINGDGYADLLLGAPEAGEAGKSYVVFGKADGMAVDIEGIDAGTSGGGFVLEGAAAGDLSGRSVSVIGDVNGDGLDDLAIGAPEANGDAGRSYVVFGKADSSAVELSSLEVPSTLAGFAINGSSVGDYSGLSVAAAGDVNGDGLADLVIGAYGANPASKEDAGRSYVVFGKSDGSAVELSALEGASPTGGFVINGSSALDYSGGSVAGAGDVNGDGLADLVIGAYGANPDGKEDAGRSYVVFGKADGSAVELSALEGGSSTGGFVINGSASADYSGWSVAGAGDVNGDGLADLVIGAYGANPDGKEDAGRSYVVFGKADGAVVELSVLDGGLPSGGFVIEGAVAGDRSGWSISAAGDVNGDGLADLLVGAPESSGGEGVSYLIFGKTSSLEISLSSIESGIFSNGFMLEGSSSGGQSGWSVAGAGDSSGDGQGDLLIGSSGDWLAAGSFGEAALVFGSRQFPGSQVDWVGSEYDPDRTGSSGVETLVGSAANNTITGGGGADILYGGAGNDLFVFTAFPASSFSRIDGGSGIDSLQLTEAGLNLDLTQIANQGAGTPGIGSRIESIERIDLGSDSEANMLTIGLQDVLDMSGMNLFNNSNGWDDGTYDLGALLEARHQMVIDGAAADSVDLDATAFTMEGTVTHDFVTYDVYNAVAAHAQLLINSAISTVG